MGVLHGTRQDGHQPRRHPVTDRPISTFQPVRQAWPVDEHRDDISGRPGPPGLQDRHEVGMVQPRRRPDLSLEPTPRFAMRQDLDSRDLQGNLATEVRVLGQIHDSESASAQFANDRESTEPSRPSLSRIGVGWPDLFQSIQDVQDSTLGRRILRREVVVPDRGRVNASVQARRGTRPDVGLGIVIESHGMCPARSGGGPGPASTASARPRH